MPLMTIGRWCLFGLLVLMVPGAPASAQSVDEVDAELDEIDDAIAGGIADLESCDDSLDGVVAKKPEDEDSLEEWQAYATNIAQWYLACRALKAGDPRPVLMKLLEAALAKLPPAPQGPDAVDPARHVRARGDRLRGAIGVVGLAWAALNARWNAEREIAEAAVARRRGR